MDQRGRVAWSLSKLTQVSLVLWLVFQMLNFPPAIASSSPTPVTATNTSITTLPNNTLPQAPLPASQAGTSNDNPFGLVVEDANQIPPPANQNQFSANKISSAGQSGKLNLILELQDEPAVVRQVQLQQGQKLAATQLQASTKTYLGQLEGSQQNVLAGLSKLKVQVLYRMQRVYNGIAISLDDPSQLSQLYQLPGVKAVHELVPKKLADYSSATAIGATQLWPTSGPNLTGEGVKIAIIDSGIDYKHADFGGTSASTFPTTKVAGGYDFVGNDYDGTNTPQPGPVPQDCAMAAGQGGHGTHVAGIAAGYGVKADGSTYTGAYDSAALLASSLVISPGIAPKATLYAYKVFGCKSLNSESLLVDQAIERAIDPNQDGDFSDRADIINLSLGSPFGSTYDSTAIAANNAALLGVMVVAAAGNSGDVYYSTSSPASADRVVSVASSVDSWSVLNGFKVNSPPELAQPNPYPATEAIFSPDLAASGPLTASVKLPISATNQTGCNPFDPAETLTGTIVLVVRGGCSFKLKAQQAQQAGAAGLLLYNNQPGDPAEMGDDPVVTTTITIPVFMAGQTTGQALVNALGAAKPASVTFSAAYRNTVVSQNNNRVDTLSVFSARGPRRGDSFLKPDLAAPGESIFSARSGSGSAGLSESGTSMASPQVAGALALLVQQHKTENWSVEELKALAMNTATPAVRTAEPPGSTRYGPGRIGAGRIDLVAANQSKVVAYNASSPGLVSLSYGSLEVEAGASPVQYNRTLRIANKSQTPASYSLAYQGVINVAGVSFGPGQTSVNLPAGGTVDVNVSLSLNPAQLQAGRDPSNNGDNSWLSEAGGYLVLTPSGATAGPVLRVPVYAAPRLVSKMASSQTALNFGTAPSANTSLGLTGQGLNTGSNYPTATLSLVSALELQHQSPALTTGTGGYRSADLKYVGVTSDYPLHSNNLGDVTLYFGLATYGRWSSPNPDDTQFRIYLDINNDGRDDFVLYNTTLSQANGELADSDRFVGNLQSLATGATAVTGPLNGVSPATRDTALFNSSVMVLPLPVSLLGLTPGQTRISYHILSYQRDTAGPVDSTPTLAYDLAKAGLNLTGGGEGNNPILYRDLPGQSVSVKYNLAGFSANSSLGVLLLHHHNGSANQAQAIAVGNLAPGFSSNPLPGETLQVGSAEVGKVTTSTLLINQTGQADLVVNASATPISGPQASEFSLISPAFPLTLTGGTTVTRQIVVQCQPGALDERSATLTLTTNDPGRSQVSYPLSCKGVPPVFISTGDGKWVWQNPQPQGGTLSSISCPSARVCYIPNSQNPIMMVTADQGNRWYTQDTGAPGGIQAVGCATIAICYAGGNGFFVKTTDAGSSWQVQSLAQPDLITNISCPGAQVCYATGDTNNWLYKTIDGGASWMTSTYQLNAKYYKLSCPALDTCYLAGKRNDNTYFIVKTISGAQSWSEVRTDLAENYNDLSCPSSTVCYATFINSSGIPSYIRGVIATTDGGISWQVKLSHTFMPGPPRFHYYYSALACASPLECRVATDSYPEPGQFYETTDGGTTWVSDTVHSTVISNLACPRPEACYALSTKGQLFITRSSNPGNWQSQSLLLNFGNSDFFQNFNTVVCPSLTNCYAGGNYETLAATKDGGYTWTTQRSTFEPTFGGNSVSSISCVSADICYTTVLPSSGYPGGVYSTTDGGINWGSKVFLPGQYSFAAANGIRCSDASNCLLVGSNGMVLKTIDGGNTWNSRISKVTATLNGISCPSATNCIAIGNSGAIIKSTDGGDTWDLQTSGLTVDLLALSCPDSSNCYAAGAGGKVIYSNDGGVSWVPRDIGPTGYAQANLYCPEALVCYQVSYTSAGANSKVFFTKDGGQNWTVQPQNQVARAITCLNSNDCTLVGEKSLILSNATNWKPRSLNTSNGLNRMACPTQQACIAVGVSGTIQLSGDGGQTWQTGNSPISNTNITLYDISCSSSLCVTVGQNGTILASADLGHSWVVQSSPVTVTLYGVSCYSTACVAVGEQGFILGGSGFILGGSGFILGGSWTVQPSNTNVTLYGISCTLNYCFAVGAQGFILGGSGFILGGSGFILGGSWTVQPSGTNLTLYAIYCDDRGCIVVGEQGFILGGSGFILGGSGFILGGSWQPHATSTLNTLHSVSCQPQTGTCYAVGANGTVLSGSSRPGSWIPEESSTLRGLNGIACSATCLSSGSGGTVVARTALGGPNLTPGFDSLPRPGSQLDFGQVAVGQITTATLTISSRGALAVQVYTPTITGLNPANFSLAVPAPGAFPVALSGSLDFRLRCQPSASGERLATLNILTNDPNQPVVTYRLRCVGSSLIMVTTAADRGSGSLRAALALAQTGDVISFTLATPVTIPVNSLLPPLRKGVKLEGICSLASGAGITLDGHNVPPGTPGLTLEGNNSVTGLRLIAFRGPALRTAGGGNKLKCINISP